MFHKRQDEDRTEYFGRCSFPSQSQLSSSMIIHICPIAIRPTLSNCRRRWNTSCCPGHLSCIEYPGCRDCRNRVTKRRILNGEFCLEHLAIRRRFATPNHCREFDPHIFLIREQSALFYQDRIGRGPSLMERKNCRYLV